MMLRVDWLTDLSQISENCWLTLFQSDFPFTDHAFLNALANGKSVDSNSGWQSQHLAVWQNEQLVALVPGYLKTHSYGEYLFDWQIAQAYQQLQLPYYPKWIAALPFTPVTGPRLGMRQGTDQHAVLSVVCQFLKAELKHGKLHSVQWLYPEADLAKALAEQGLWLRFDVQFLWQNQRYTDFNDFLARLNSRKRKQIAKERAACAGLSLQTLTGEQLTESHWQQLIHCYQATYLKRSGHHGYITPQSFQLLAKTMAKQIVVFAAFDSKQPQQLVAAALCFRGKDTLYGRYWGALEHNDYLHFELCYYQGIEYCIKQGLAFFDAGAQGEHKLKRGFAPVLRYGAYCFADTPLSAAIQDYFKQEQRHLQQYFQAAAAALPYKAPVE
jgi:hypothetical protein